MNFSPRVIKSILDIAKSIRSVTDLVNYATRVILQTWPEINQISEQICKVIPIPAIVKQMGVKGADLKNADFLSGLVGSATGNSEVSNFISQISQLASGGGGIAEIFNKVVGMQFQIKSDTFTEGEEVLSILRTAMSSISSASK